MLVQDVDQIRCFEASARPYSEFELNSGKDKLLKLVYLFDSEVEALGGVAYRCEYAAEHWTLQFYRTSYLERESYKVFRKGTLVLATDVFRILRRTALTYSDGTVWRYYLGLAGPAVTDSQANRVLRVSTRPNWFLGGSRIRIDRPVEHDRLLPLLIVLTHFTTHYKE